MRNRAIFNEIGLIAAPKDIQRFSAYCVPVPTLKVVMLPVGVEFQGLAQSLDLLLQPLRFIESLTP
ncbi:hypothetical protein A1395_28950 [Pseudomonas protegens]|nr:hypothetical protein A1395_28950 [Pseudomonas protegens]